MDDTRSWVAKTDHPCLSAIDLFVRGASIDDIHTFVGFVYPPPSFANIYVLFVRRFSLF